MRPIRPRLTMGLGCVETFLDSLRIPKPRSPNLGLHSFPDVDDRAPILICLFTCAQGCGYWLLAPSGLCSRGQQVGTWPSPQAQTRERRDTSTKHPTSMFQLLGVYCMSIYLYVYKSTKASLKMYIYIYKSISISNLFLYLYLCIHVVYLYQP